MMETTMHRFGRRAFLQGAASLFVAPAFAKETFAAETDIIATRRVIEVHGRAVSVFGLDGPSGFSGLSLMKGERFRLRLRNDLRERTLIHWHGLTPPSDQDG